MRLDNTISFLKTNIRPYLLHMVVALLLLFFIFLPVHKYNKKLKLRIRQNTSLLQKYQVLAKNAQSIRKQHKFFEKYLKVLDDKSNKASFLYNLIDRSCRKLKISIGDLRPVLSDSDRVAFDLELSGQLDQLLELLYEIESQYPFLVVSGMRLQNSNVKESITSTMHLEFLE